jgi:hypothetical protein
MRLVALAIVAAGCEEPIRDPEWEHVTGDADLDGYTVDDGDCNDEDAAINPGATETWYDGVDQDCDGNDDDQDVDGFPVGEDCNDADAAVFPGAEEVCDGFDNDCDGDRDEGVTLEAWIDLDGDGYGDEATPGEFCAIPGGWAANDDDCDDADDAINPDADETCDGVDEDCDGEIDNGATDLHDTWPDADGDGFGDAVGEVLSECTTGEGRVENGGDCDDADASVNPGATELCDDIDQDCDGDPLDGLDSDGDGIGDCDDVEECDGVDNDGDGEIDEGDAIDRSTWYSDVDEDGYGDDLSTTLSCSGGAGLAAVGGDCDDLDPDVNPGASELDDGLDQDCDDLVDEDFVAVGDLVITEVARQPRMGAESTDVSAQWFEVLNVSTRDLDLSAWLFTRTNDEVGTDGVRVDPAEALLLAAGSYAVFCKTTDWTAAADADSTLVCDYTWGDPDEESDFEGTYHDNTFNLQRDEDRLSVSLAGTEIDAVAWVFESGAEWPRDATYSMSLDPGSLTAAGNDDIAAWCSASEGSTWWEGGADPEHGTPGAVNDTCE